MKPWRIMHVTDTLAPGGKERMLVDLANQAARDHHDVSVCVTRSDTTLAAELLPGIDLLVLGRTRRFEWGPLRRLAAWAREWRVDLFHCHGRSSFSLLAALKALGAIEGRILLHDHYGDLDANTVPAWFRVARHSLALHVGVCDELGSWAERAGVPPGRIKVIENALDLSRIDHAPLATDAPRLRAESPVPIGVMVGSVQRRKGLDIAIEGLRLLGGRVPLRLLVSGEEVDPAFAEACRVALRRHGLEASVTFLGQRSDALGLLKMADFAVCASRAESGPLALIETLASGLPFVSSRVGAVGRRLAREGLPELVEPGQAQPLAAALERLLRLSPAERHARGVQGRECARRLFDLRVAMPRWYQAYEAALGPA